MSCVLCSCIRSGCVAYLEVFEINRTISHANCRSDYDKGLMITHKILTEFQPACDDGTCFGVSAVRYLDTKCF